jgi:DNA repair protein RecO (recombination protein O)
MLIIAVRVFMLLNVQPAFVLHRRPYRETSMLVELFTRDHGRITVVARGIRQRLSVNASLLQPFTAILVSAYGKNELLNLTRVETASSTNLLLRVAANLPCGFYLNELLVYFLPKYEQHLELFAIYQATLIKLQQQDRLKCEQALRIFEKELLTAIGYGLSCKTAGQANVDSKQYYAFNLDVGFVPCQNIAMPVRRSNIFTGETINAILNNNLTGRQVLQEAKRLLGFILSLLLAGRKIHSRQLFLGDSNV